MTVISTENISYEHLTFLATYIVPLVSLNFDNSRFAIILLLILIIMGIIYVKTDLFYTNPSLALLGFSIYKVEVSTREGNLTAIVLTRSRINIGDKLKYIKLDERIFYGIVCNS